MVLINALVILIEKYTRKIFSKSEGQYFLGLFSFLLLLSFAAISADLFSFSVLLSAEERLAMLFTVFIFLNLGYRDLKIVSGIILSLFISFFYGGPLAFTTGLIFYRIFYKNPVSFGTWLLFISSGLYEFSKRSGPLGELFGITVSIPVLGGVFLLIAFFIFVLRSDQYGHRYFYQLLILSYLLKSWIPSFLFIPIVLGSLLLYVYYRAKRIGHVEIILMLGTLSQFFYFPFILAFLVLFAEAMPKFEFRSKIQGTRFVLFLTSFMMLLGYSLLVLSHTGHKGAPFYSNYLMAIFSLIPFARIMGLKPIVEFEFSDWQMVGIKKIIHLAIFFPVSIYIVKRWGVFSGEDFSWARLSIFPFLAIITLFTTIYLRDLFLRRALPIPRGKTVAFKKSEPKIFKKQTYSPILSIDLRELDNLYFFIGIAFLISVIVGMVAYVQGF